MPTSPSPIPLLGALQRSLPIVAMTVLGPCAATAGEIMPARAAGKTASAPVAAEPARAPADSLERLRERLAEKLGASRPADVANAHLLRVSNRADSAAASPAAQHLDHAAQPAAAVNARRLALAATVAPPARTPKPAAAAVAASTGAWSYAGEAGPAAWGGMRPDFATCANGQRQSPIDIRGGIAVDLEPIFFDYKASGFGVIDNGHTVQVNLSPGNHLQVSGRRFELAQFHFHRPSETRIAGRQFEMEVHLVHRDAEGRLAVVAIPLERGLAQPVVQTVWNHLPLEKGEEQPAGAVIDLNHLLPPDRGYYTFMGSLTTPPCSEGVLWLVMRQPVAVSQQQIDIFARLYAMNARPAQAAAGRLIKQSQ